MPIVDASVGTITANSYVTVAEADSYFDGFYGRPLWAQKSIDDKSSLVITASRLLDQYMSWNGYRALNQQSMEWPRIGSWFQGYELAKDIIPTRVKYAVFELAYYLAENGAISFAAQSVDRIKVGPIDLEFSDTSVDAGLPGFIEMMLTNLGVPIIVAPTAARSIVLERS